MHAQAERISQQGAVTTGVTLRLFPVWIIPVFEHGRSGWVVPAGSAEALRRGLDLLLEDPQRCLALAAAGRIRVRAFDIDSTVAAYSALFSEEAGQMRTWSRPVLSQLLVYETYTIARRAQVSCHFFPEIWQLRVIK